MEDYKRLISYIYSYRKGAKDKNAGFAKIESRNDICKINISLRIADELMNETDDNMLNVYFFSRNQKRIKKVFLDRIRIVNGCSMLKLRWDSENMPIALSEVSGIFICSHAFLNGNSTLNIIYASEWDDIPINVEDFKENTDNHSIEKNLNMRYNVRNREFLDERDILKASSIDEVEPVKDKIINDLPIYKSNQNEMNAQIKKMTSEKSKQKLYDYISDNELQNSETVEQQQIKDYDFSEELNIEEPNKIIKQANREESNIDTNQEETVNATETINQEEVAESQKTAIETVSADNTDGVIAEKSECDNEAEQVKEEPLKAEQPTCNCMEDEDNEEEYIELNTKKQETRENNYFRVLCSCYPKIRLNEIDGECIKITPHDISYLPKKYWHLCNNNFMLHGYKNYKYLIMCEKKIGEQMKYMIGVPGMFHPKEQMIARMFGFTEFEGNNRNEAMNFGYWCMYL